jgi:serine/threonine-protein kinase
MEAFGPWQLESLIAVGGLGEVWRATHLPSHRPSAVLRGPAEPSLANSQQRAALKRVHTHLARNEEILAQFAVEAQLATALPRHPNVVHAHETGAVDGRPYLAMEIAPGEDVRRLLAPPVGAAAGATIVLPRTRVVAIVAQAADAIAHLHAHGFAHGDVNPGNLVVDDADRVTLIDLGVARRLGEGGAVRGTHAYMAPEQVRGEAWTTATDVFALGVVLWELAAGARLFHRGPPWLSLAAVVEEAAPALADPALDAIAQAALVKDPAARLTSASELAARLRAAR